MSTAAVMLVRDEIDIIEFTLRHLAAQVDAIIVTDNLSTDGTYELMKGLELGVPFYVWRDHDPAHYQSRKTTALAVKAVELGHEWVVPCDADEYWYQPQGYRISDWLESLQPEMNVIAADLYDHKPTAADPADEPNPFARIGWRVIEKGFLPKVAVKMHSGVVIQDGNHGAAFPVWHRAVVGEGLVVRHFSWRSEAQFVHKRRIGYDALNATKLPSTIGEHWRMFGPDVPDETIGNHFREWFYSYDPANDPTMIYDPINGRTGG